MTTMNINLDACKENRTHFVKKKRRHDEKEMSKNENIYI